MVFPMNIFFSCLPPHHRHWQNLDLNFSCICNFADYFQICHYHISGHFCKYKILWEGQKNLDHFLCIIWAYQRSERSKANCQAVNSSKNQWTNNFFHLTKYSSGQTMKKMEELSPVHLDLKNDLIQSLYFFSKMQKKIQVLADPVVFLKCTWCNTCNFFGNSKKKII